MFTSVLAASWYVSPTGDDTNPGTSAKPLKLIQTALQNSSTGDTIYLEAGTYTGPGDIDLAISQVVTIASVSGASMTSIDCAGSSSQNHLAMTISSVGTSTTPLVLQGITIKNGYGSSGSTFNGGALNIANSYVTLSGCTFTKNYVSNFGGAIYEDLTSSLTLTNCSFTANSAGSYAGAIYNLGFLSVKGSSFTSNSSVGSAGVLYNNGSCMLTGCNLLTNKEANGGVVENDQQASIELNGCTVSSNTASNGTSGLYNNNGQVTAENCLFSQNTASQQGAGIYTTGNMDFTALIENCVFTGNAASAGGGIYINSPALVVGCTLTGNTASAATGGGGVYIDTNGSARCADDILWADSAPALTSSDEIRNIGSIYITNSDINLGYAGTGNIKVNPLFVATGNYHIQATSPCLYTGATFPDLTTDYAGRLRHSPPSMGAYEGGSLWTPVASAVGPNQNKRVLWVNENGEAALWTITPTGTQSALAFGPFAGYTPIALAVGPDNNAYLSWQQASGEVAVWDIAANGTHVNRAFNPGAGWSLVSLSVGPDSYLHITWTDKPGHLWIWNVSTTGTIQYQEYGPE
jgi:predicted outer membrane repeat protein